MRGVFTTCAFMVCLLATAEEIVAGGTPIEVPPPEGFAAPPIDVAQRLHRQVPETNEQLLVLLPDALMERAADFAPAELTRYFVIQVSKRKFESRVIPYDFAMAKETMKKVNAEAVRIVKERYAGEEPGAIDYDKAIADHGFVPMAMHLDEEKVFGYSGVAKVTVPNAAGEPVECPLTTTALVVHVRERMLFLYIYGGPDDLEWGREAGKAWADAIIAANEAAD